MNFTKAIKDEIFSHFGNDHNDNWDYIRFGDTEPLKGSSVRKKIQKWINKRGYYPKPVTEQIFEKSLQIKKFEFLYDHLETNDDKDLLLKVIAYRILGHRKVKLPLNNPEYFVRLASLKILSDKFDTINPNFQHLILNRINLNKIGYPIDFYFTEGGVMTDFIIKQYEYNKNGVVIKAEKDEYVVDGGGCWGDTALYFANEVGIDGKVLSFEFIPNNLKIFKKNISLNSNLSDSIEIIERPLWDDSLTMLYYKDNGPGSKVEFVPFDGMDGHCTTMSINDLLVENKIERLDFIKLDIEGAEKNALKGAEKVIKNFKPKLAVALYHSVDDFDDIPRLIKEICPAYKFYFSHCTMNSEESILFAKAD